MPKSKKVCKNCRYYLRIKQYIQGGIKVYNTFCAKECIPRPKSRDFCSRWKREK